MMLFTIDCLALFEKKNIQKKKKHIIIGPFRSTKIRIKKGKKN